MKPTIALIGPGKVGCAVTQRLHEAGYPIKAVVGRDRQRAADGCRFIGCAENVANTAFSSAIGAEIILLAVPDDQIKSLAEELRIKVTLSAKQVLIHFSGLHPADIMRAEDSSVATLSIHPLLPFANRQIASERLSGCPCALEGDMSTIPLGQRLVDAFGGLAFRIESEQKALYHTSACIASNFLVGLLATAADLLADCGIEANDPIKLLMPLVRASLDNIERLGPQQGLTGPIVRGDVGTVASHLATLKNTSPELLPLYRMLGNQTLAVAKKSSRLPQEQVERLRKLINAKQNDSTNY